MQYATTMAAHEHKEIIIVVETRNNLKGFDEDKKRDLQDFERQMKKDCKDFKEEVQKDLKEPKCPSSIEIVGSTDQLKNTEEQSNETGQM